MKVSEFFEGKQCFMLEGDKPLWFWDQALELELNKFKSWLYHLRTFWSGKLFIIFLICKMDTIIFFIGFMGEWNKIRAEPSVNAKRNKRELL